MQAKSQPKRKAIEFHNLKAKKRIVSPIDLHPISYTLNSQQMPKQASESTNQTGQELTSQQRKKDKKQRYARMIQQKKDEVKKIDEQIIHDRDETCTVGKASKRLTKSSTKHHITAAKAAKPISKQQKIGKKRSSGAKGKGKREVKVREVKKSKGKN